MVFQIFRQAFTALCVSLVAGCATMAAPATRVTLERPNIIVIVTDDLGYGDLSCYGAKKIATPNVDRLAAEGLRFTQAYAPASTCTPSRYSLLTGDYAWRQTAKKTSILDGDAPLAIEPGSLTLPEMLRRSGYATGIIGKWHLGLGDGLKPVDFNKEIKPGPREIGFDYSYFIPATVDRVPSVWIENHRVVGLDAADPISVSYLKNISDEPTGLQHPELLRQAADKQHSGTIINGISRIGYMKGGNAARFKDEELARTVADQTIAFMQGHSNQPFFLYVGMFEPHVPRVTGERFVGASECGVRGDVIVQIDMETGQIIDALERLHMMTNTLVLFTSDNGPILFDGYEDNSVAESQGHQPAGGLRGWKYLVYEGGTRVPFIAWWPGKVRAGVSDQMLCLTDVMRTCGALVGAKIPKRAAVDSLDELPVLLGMKSKPIRTSVVQQGISGAFAVRQGDWKYIPANADKGGGGMGSGANPDDPRFAAAIIREPLLFNLASDPGETNNVIAKFQDKAKELMGLLKGEKAKVAGTQPEAD